MSINKKEDIELDVSSDTAAAVFDGDTLISKKDFNSYSATPFDDMMFVKDNWRIKEVTAKDCPSPNAWNYILMMRNDAEFRNEFYTKIFPRLVPSKTQIDNMMSFQDRGQNLKDTLSKLIDKQSIQRHLEDNGLCPPSSPHFESQGVDDG